MQSNLIYVFGSAKQVVVVGIAGFLLSGCSGSPNDENATSAVKSMLGNGRKITGISLPPSVGLRLVKVGDCADAQPLEGKYCAVNIVSEEVPIIGSIVVPMTMRFAKQGNAWIAFLN